MEGLGTTVFGAAPPTLAMPVQQPVPQDEEHRLALNFVVGVDGTPGSMVSGCEARPA